MSGETRESLLEQIAQLETEKALLRETVKHVRRQRDVIREAVGLYRVQCDGIARQAMFDVLDGAVETEADE